MTAWLAAVLLAQAAPPADQIPWRRHEAAIGGYVADLSSSVQVNTDAGVGANVDIEELLGLENTLTQLRLGVSFHLADRHRLTVSATDISRHASKSLTADVDFDGETYPIGTVVDSELNIRLFNLVYGYSVVWDDRVNLAVTFGIHTLRTQVGIESASVGAESEEFTLPIPLPGFRMDVALAKDLYLRQNFEFLWLRFDNFEGLMAEVNIGLEWAAFEHVGFGVAYNHMRINLEMEDSNFPAVDFEGRFEFDFSGFMIYTVVYF
jgi:hypothetical protein